MFNKPEVCVLLCDPDLDKVLMVEPFRAGCLDDENEPWKLELIAGPVDNETQVESVEFVAIRQTKGGAGIKIDRLLLVCEYYNSPGSSNEKLNIFCARIDVAKASEYQAIFGLNDEHEDIRPVIIDRLVAELGVKEALINNAMSIISIQWPSLNLELVRHIQVINKSDSPID
ncbi:MAG: ADP-ribose diphosphatase [Gammaproteobacteria bacterium]|nr:ADP-ribose diphosphatase [Gammaproteobacteria bacterium]